MAKNNRTPDRTQAILNMVGGDDIEVIRHLTEPVTITLPSIKRPKRLKDRRGVWLSSDVVALFARVERLPAASEHIIARCDLVQSLNDFQLVEELGGKDAAVFTVADVELAIGQLIDAAEAGSNDLMANGKSNIMYVADPENPGRLLYVHVYRYDDEWHMYCYPAHAGPRDVVLRVFKATAA